MKTIHLKFFIFILIVASYSLAVYLDSMTLSFFSKIMIAPALFPLVYSKKMASKQLWFYSLALFFSALGDGLLFFQVNQEYYFIFGLLSFLLAHICYILLFNSASSRKLPSIIISILIFGYAISFNFLMRPFVGDLFFPIIVYSSVISVMLLFSFKVNPLVIAGAITFALSDTLLAVNKFYLPIPNENFLIMGTYIAAQALIALGWSSEKLAFTKKLTQ